MYMHHDKQVHKYNILDFIMKEKLLSVIKVRKAASRVPAEAAGKFSSPELTFSADLFGVRSISCYRSGT